MSYDEFTKVVRNSSSQKLLKLTVELDNGDTATLNVEDDDFNPEKCAVLLVSTNETMLVLGKHNEQFWGHVVGMIFRRFKRVKEIVEMNFMIRSLKEMAELEKQKAGPFDDMLADLGKKFQGRG